MKRYVALLVAVGSVVLLISSDAVAQLNQEGVLGRFSSQDEVSNQICVQDTAVFTTIADRTFVQGGTGDEEIVVTFSGVFSPLGVTADAAVVRLVVQGTGPGDHSGAGVRMYDTAGGTAAHSYTFVSDMPGVTPGTRRVRVQMRSDVIGGDGVCVDQRSTVIMHR
jgi:hypothetical protein